MAEKKTLRYSALRKEMTNITDTVLASTLKVLMADGPAHTIKRIVKTHYCNAKNVITFEKR